MFVFYYTFIHLTNLLYLFQLPLVSLGYVSVFLTFILNVLQTDQSITFALIEGLVEYVKMGKLFQHFLDMIVNEIQ